MQKHLEWMRTKVHAIGSPRTDILFANVRDTARKNKNFLKNIRSLKIKNLFYTHQHLEAKVLYPTPYTPHIDLDKLAPSLLENNKVLLFNLHPYMNENEEYMKKTNESAVFWNRNEYTIEELLMISDALISDYSSVIYDFAILEKPIALYCYDYEKYNKQRGFYIDIKQLLPTTYFEKEDDLFNWIVSDIKDTTEVKRLKREKLQIPGWTSIEKNYRVIFEKLPVKFT